MPRQPSHSPPDRRLCGLPRRLRTICRNPHALRVEQRGARARARSPFLPRACRPDWSAWQVRAEIERASARIAYEGAPSLLASDSALCFQEVERIAYRAPAHAKLLRENALRGKASIRGNVARIDKREPYRWQRHLHLRPCWMLSGYRSRSAPENQCSSSSPTGCRVSGSELGRGQREGLLWPRSQASQKPNQ